MLDLQPEISVAAGGYNAFVYAISPEGDPLVMFMDKATYATSSGWYRPSDWQPIVGPEGYPDTVANAANASGVVGGIASNHNDYSIMPLVVIWNDGNVQQLSELIATPTDLTIFSVAGITDKGEIACGGSDPAVVTHGVLLKPTG